MQIAFFDAKPYDIPAFEKLGRENGISITFLDTKLNRDSVALAADCQAVCVFVNDRVDAEVIDRLHERGVALIALRCAGYNNVDIKHAFGKVHVVHVPAYSPHAVAEHAMALLLTSVRRIHKAYNRTREFNFSLTGLTGFDLHGKTVGIVGAGKIGCIFGEICRGFGMKILANDPYPVDMPGFAFVGLDELFEKSDIISLHCPLTAETEHLIHRESIRKMKKGVVLLNTSRGKLIDTEALIDGIKERKIGAACLDVYEEEGNIFYNDFSGHIVDDDLLARLICMPNVIVTSHQGFLTEEALQNIAETTIRNVMTFLQGDRLCENELCYHCGKIEHCIRERMGKCF